MPSVPSACAWTRLPAHIHLFPCLRPSARACLAPALGRGSCGMRDGSEGRALLSHNRRPLPSRRVDVMGGVCARSSTRWAARSSSSRTTTAAWPTGCPTRSRCCTCSSATSSLPRAAPTSSACARPPRGTPPLLHPVFLFLSLISFFLSSFINLMFPRGLPCPACCLHALAAPSDSAGASGALCNG